MDIYVTVGLTEYYTTYLELSLLITSIFMVYRIYLFGVRIHNLRFKLLLTDNKQLALYLARSQEEGEELPFLGMAVTQSI